MRIDLLRHGISEPSNPEGDHARALTPEGERAIRALGERLGRDGWRPDRVFSSPLKRARDTAAIVLGAAGTPLVAGVRDELEPEVDPREVASLLPAIADGARHVLLVAHQPMLGRLAGYWTGQITALAPGELVVIQFDSAAAPRAGALVERIEPR
jgi:phosphohistidine phosphatase